MAVDRGCADRLGAVASVISLEGTAALGQLMALMTTAVAADALLVRQQGRAREKSNARSMRGAQRLFSLKSNRRVLVQH